MGLIFYFFFSLVSVLGLVSYTQDDICDAWENSYSLCVISSPKVFPYNRTRSNATALEEALGSPSHSRLRYLDTPTSPWYFTLDPRPNETYSVAFNASVSLREGGSLSCSHNYTCQLLLSAVGDWQQGLNSSVVANTIDLVAASLVVSVGSVLSATGLGLAHGWLPGGGWGGGGAYAGSGGLPACTSNLTHSCCSGIPFTSTNFSSLGMGFSGMGEDPSDWDLAWGSGGGGVSGGRSGWAGACECNGGCTS